MNPRRSALVGAGLVVVLVAAVLIRMSTGSRTPNTGIGVYLSGNNAGSSSYTAGWSSQQIGRAHV